jgi:hypothetical protein
MNQALTSNISTAEQARRYAIGTALILLVLANNAFPAWIALVACYPILTAVIQWDPVNYVFQAVINKFNKLQSTINFDRTTTA